MKNKSVYLIFLWPGMTAPYGLDGPGIESRWVRDCSYPPRTAPGAHSASCTMGTVPSLSRDQSGLGVALTARPHLEPRLKKEQSYNSPSGPSSRVLW